MRSRTAGSVAKIGWSDNEHLQIAKIGFTFLCQVIQILMTNRLKVTGSTTCTNNKKIKHCKTE